jgi:NitT/TauT family transport system ATP-binding protein
VTVQGTWPLAVAAAPTAASAAAFDLAEPSMNGSDETIPVAPYIGIDSVTKIYTTARGSVGALDGVSLSVSEHEFLSIVGPSGCGKSTLLMIVSGLIPATSGAVTIAGTKVNGPYTELGIVFQRDVLLDWRNVLGNVMLPCEVRRMPRKTSAERSLALLDSVGLAKCAKSYPFELSGGMRQRVAICRALVHNPPLLLMDEPFGALDALTRDQLNVDLQHLNRQLRKTVFFVTHSISEAVFLGDRVVVMSGSPGRVKEIIDVDLPRPRALAIREEPEFTAYVRRIREIFLESGVLTERQDGQ